jgi:2,6-dihydroxypseudooxynicotine hydrolase
MQQQEMIPERFLKASTPRLLADGIEYVDLLEVAAGNPATMDDWCVQWMRVGRRYEELARQALQDQNQITAGELFWRASLCYHYGQFMLWHNSALKREAARKKVENYKRGAPLFSPRAERMEVPFEGSVIPCYLRIPENHESDMERPLVLLIGGLESTKEEYYAFENLCLKRGLATLAFDGPGQGELLFAGMKSRPDFEKVTTTVIDHIVNQGGFERARIGVLGRSLGGYYASRSAASDRRIVACVAWGVIYDFSAWDKIPDGHKDGWTFTAGCNDWGEAKRYYADYSLKGISEKIVCPLYILQGKMDNIFSWEDAAKLAREAKGKTTLVIEEKGTHCAHNLSHIVRPRMIDWLSKELKIP